MKRLGLGRGFSGAESPDRVSVDSSLKVRDSHFYTVPRAETETIDGFVVRLAELALT